ncbi:hypothetical protein [Singulisphaera acidiphila]|uniref:DUF2325 domain-containing protein n=1 Tax=Singulisphaera acidiphila (strain ATCC BAA-1392 / DSM 18658 / VKM B-2454 / MOB10) TaxID=886293 RepID=L0D7I9_SINAD|nr:hypothetical protein [Singulisphaera acidiphila]AGA24606.1 hypothetical protein Sinac_0148 [Singulisphaera acidiphila DSM 18658]
MTPSLERLAELVRQAEAKSRAKKLGAETQQAAEQFRTAEVRANRAAQRLREVRPVRIRELEQAEVDEQHLKELVRKLAQYKAALDSDADPENLIADAQTEIERKKREAQAEIESVSRESDEARRELRTAMDHYQQLRRELDRLQPQLADKFSNEDRLLWDAEMHFPGGQFQTLAREVEASLNYFGMLGKLEQYSQLKIWIGRFRMHQAANDGEMTEENQALSQRTFHQLKTLSKQYEPGYIEAFRHDFHTDWAAYVAEAQEQLLLATETARRSKDWEQQRQESQARDLERQQLNREAGLAALEELKALMARTSLPDEGVEEFLIQLKQVVSGLGASDPTLLELVMPYREVISGGNGLRALRRNLDRIRQEESKDDDTLQERYEDLISATQGLRVLMIGGSVREDVRRTLQRLFEFDKLDWEPYEDAKPAMLDSIERRVRNHGVDLVLILKSFIGHHVPERLRPLCEQQGIPCLMVERGYGPTQVGETLRRGLLKSA